VVSERLSERRVVVCSVVMSETGRCARSAGKPGSCEAGAGGYRLGELKLGVEWVTNGRRDQRDVPRHAT
jgi:hypothetical protein